MAGYDILRMDKEDEINIHEFLMWVANDIDQAKLEERLRKKR